MQTQLENLSPEEARRRVDEYLQGQSELDLLRFITCGSVDDGKSTLIGRMLYEAQLVFDDQVTALKNDSKRQGTQGGDIDFAVLPSTWRTGFLVQNIENLLLQIPRVMSSTLATWSPVHLPLTLL